jgi:chemotaxis protein MotB
MSNPVLDAQGNVDKDASRRVEVKFRLKDDEMIQELNRIMSSEAMRSTPSTQTAGQTDTSRTSGN